MIKNALIALLFISFVLPGRAESDVCKFTCLSLGTTVELTICLDGISSAAAKSAADESMARVKEIDKMLSVFDKKSAVSAINDDISKRTRSLNPDLYSLIKRCNEYYALTRGAFDITVEPLVEAWGFGPSQIRKSDPCAAAEALKYVGMDKMVFDDANKAVSFDDPRMRIDFGGIAKGYAVDEAVKILKRRGISSAIVNMGGDLYCMGSNTAAGGWSIGIRNPDDKKSIIAALLVKNKAVATSGSYENFYIYGGREYSHIINPRTGRVARNNLRSVTALADDCMTADALATAVFVLGERKGLELVEKLPGIDVFLVVKDGAGARISMSGGMEGYMAKR